MHACEVHAHEIHACERHVYEVHTRKMHACEVYGHEIYAREIHTYEVHACEIYIYDLRVFLARWTRVASVSIDTKDVLSFLIVGDSAVRLLITLGARSAW
jgi:hypothetical protein